MATEVSEQYKITHSLFKQPHLHFLIRANKFLTVQRDLARKVHFMLRAKPAAEPTTVAIANNFDAGSEHFKMHRWTFVENILESSFYQKLVSNWPRRYFLKAPKSIEKSYDVGFKWVAGQKSEPEHIEYFPQIKNLFDYLRSDEFCQRVTKFTGSVIGLKCYSFLINTSYPGTIVAGHKDSVAKLGDGARPHLNMVFFINATGGKNSGGLVLSRDNDLRDIIFEPTNLLNSCLIYDSIADFYHGFDKINFGKFRWAINAQFCREDRSNFKEE